MSYRLYVARLKPQVLENRRYREANPHYIPGKPCVYVGATGRTRDERFEQHKTGYKANRFVKRFGTVLFEWAFSNTGEFERWADAVVAEEALAARYRSMGWAVWQN
ncbi:MAG: hypothetical protein HOD00_00185 [Gemmatimonadales bacterium]|mgnify:FL=1|nr:hypothetical protein [Gemmatimonadales bacterium]MBT6376597.1 hypothetical protein [Gemmatimonadales bacterium]MBT6887751.1 hypothetical protein [Gemmatimonadales bacterium]